MASAVTLKAVGDWSKEVGVPLHNALAVSMDITGRTGEEACRHAIILMAQSAGKLARKSKPKRRKLRDEHGQYMETWQKNGNMKKLYDWAFSPGNPNRLNGTFEEALPISGHGLAKRSWLWGLARIGAREKSKRIGGAFRLYTITSEKANGYVKENRLSYISKAMPSGWEREVERTAGNKIMAQAREKLERKWRHEMGMGKRLKGETKQTQRDLSSYFLKGLS